MNPPRSAPSLDPRANGTGWFDVFVVAMIVTSGLLFLWNGPSWAPNVYIGSDQFGDTEFWWNGALQFAQAIIWENINITYRMGFAVFAGLIVALFGPDYAVFHKILLLLFLGIATSGYVILAGRVGRLTALAMTGALVFSPYEAEWLATSTSDALGQIFCLVSLFSLFVALGVRLRPRWLAMAGIFLALSALTRPLMAVFAAPVALFLLLQINIGLRARCVGVAIFFAAFALPMLIWTTAFYIKTGNVAAAGQQGSNFYAASNPEIQVWSGTMNIPVQEAAKARLGLPDISDAQMNQEYLYQTLANYRNEWVYHLRRLPQHVWALARFSFHNTNYSDRLDFVLRWLVRGLLTAGVALSCITNRRFLNALLALAVCVLSLWPRTSGLVVVASAAFCFLPGSNAAVMQIHRLVSSYWWAGAAALYFVGGTWGPPLSYAPQFDINALGYRLGLQFLFANEWLVILAIVSVGGVPDYVRKIPMLYPLRPWLSSASGAGATLRFARNGGVALLGGLLTIGSGIIGVRAWQASHASPVPMPSIAPVLSALCSADGNRKPRSPSEEAEPASVLKDMWNDTKPDSRKEGAHIFTGGLGGLIWQLRGQHRTRAILNQHDQYYPGFPFVLSDTLTHIEFADLLDERTWRNREGAWIVRSFREVGPHVGPVYYESLPKVQVFVPLSADGKSFDTANMIMFPLMRYASALAYAGLLTAKDSRLEWMQYPTADFKRRWFILFPPQDAHDLRSSSVEIDASDALGQRKLSLSFRAEPLPGVPVGKTPISIAIESMDAVGQKRTLLERTSQARGGATEVDTDSAEVTIPSDVARIKVTFSGLGAKDYVRVIELQLTSLDVTPKLENVFCIR